MEPEACELTALRRAFERFAFPVAKTQTSQHIKPLHWYVACRLVIEGGFNPEDIKPHPPFVVEKNRFLHHQPEKADGQERTLLGGLRTKGIDVTVSLDGIGPVPAISLKGTHNAFRNLTNRMEEAAGDCTNLHMSYPALVYGFWHVLRANEEEDQDPVAHFELAENGRYKPADVAITADQEPAPALKRLALALERLSDRDDLRDHPSRYEACGLTLVGVRKDNRGTVHPSFPDPGELLDFNRMFRRLYHLYVQRYVYQAPSLASHTRRVEWSPESPILEHTLLDNPVFSEMQPRVAPG